MKTDYKALFSDEYFDTIEEKLRIIEELNNEPNIPHWKNLSLDDIDGEIWVDIDLPSFRGLYQISNYQRIKSLEREVVDSRNAKLLKEKIRKQSYSVGYRHLNFSKSNYKKNVKTHILMARHFVPNANPRRYNRVNHINGNRDDNRPKNLEWVTKRQDVIHRYYVLKKIDKRDRKGYNSKCSTPILQFNTNGQLIKEWGSQGDINRSLGFNQTDISRACNKQRAISHGFVWRFKNDPNSINWNI